MSEQERKAYWAEHFSRQHADAALSGTDKLDFSNDRVRTQTYGWVLEAAGTLRGRRCLDAGCGTGEIAALLAASGAQVDAFDIAPAAIAALQRQQPGIRWFVGDAGEFATEQIAEAYDLIVSSEVLQYVDATRAIMRMWDHVAPGGRLMVVIPFAGCPIVQSVRDRFDGHYQGITLSAVEQLAGKLANVERVFWRGATFLEDQTLLPYGLGPWRDTFHPPAKPPNRLQIVFLRTAA